MASLHICKGCGKACFAFKQVNNIFFVCLNGECKFEGLLKIDVKGSLENSRRTENQYAL